MKYDVVEVVVLAKYWDESIFSLPYKKCSSQNQVWKSCAKGNIFWIYLAGKNFELKNCYWQIGKIPLVLPLFSTTSLSSVMFTFHLSSSSKRSSISNQIFVRPPLWLQLLSSFYFKGCKLKNPRTRIPQKSWAPLDKSKQAINV